MFTRESQMSGVDKDAEVAVVGLGAWGSATLWRLAELGVKVIGFERFGLGHAMGSSHGGSRMFRVACLEHPGLVPLAQRSLQLWRELEATTGRRLFDPTGGLLMGPKDGHIVPGTLAAARKHDLPVEVLAGDELRARLPQHKGMPDDHVAVLDPTAGLIRPEEAIRAAVAAAEARGARTFTDTKVTDVELVDGGVIIRTPTRDFKVQQVVITAGGWLSTLVADLPLETVRMPMTWFEPTGDPEPFKLERFPTFIRELGDSTAIWGHGWSGDTKVKLGLEDGGGLFDVTPADEIDRSTGPRDWQALVDRLATTVPGLGPMPSRVAVCMVTRTPDKQFVLGRPRGDQRLVIGGGCSGHGFKHATGIGEVLAETVLGKETRPMPFADPNRF